jgi:cation transport regulator ChaC
LGPARLPGYRLAFTRRSVRTGTGVADILADADGETWGVLYELDARDRDALDEKEGLGWAYVHMTVAVGTADGVVREALAYTVKQKEPAAVRPSAAYLQRLLRAAREHGFPDAYVEELERAAGAARVLPPST